MPPAASVDSKEQKLLRLLRAKHAGSFVPQPSPLFGGAKARGLRLGPECRLKTGGEVTAQDSGFS